MLEKEQFVYLKQTSLPNVYIEKIIRKVFIQLHKFMRLDLNNDPLTTLQVTVPLMPEKLAVKI